MKSIIQDNMNECIVCKTINNLHVHHVMNGPLRKKSTKYGLIVRLCASHHYGVHANQKVDDAFKRVAQEKFEEIYGHEKWMREFHKNYKI